MTARNITLDVIKGFAIIAVVLFHLGEFKYGYLGVDVFFVIAGYLTVRSVWKKIGDQQYDALQFILSRASRLWPMVMLGITISLIIGLFLMLPDDFENLAQSGFASIFFANNILCRISSSDYWAQSNEFKPLLHFWYLGVLMQFYVCFGIFAGVVKKWSKKWIVLSVCVISTISAVLYFANVGGQAVRFYYMPWRLWEFGIGIILGFMNIGIPDLQFLKYSGVDKIGAASLSIYVWHYILLAFYRYSIQYNLSYSEVSFYILCVAICSIVTYKTVEKVDIKRLGRSAKLRFVFWAISIVVIALIVYFRAGVVRDVPELDIFQHGSVRGLHSKYNERIRGFAKEFDNTDKLKVLVIGNSWARDWANVLLESKYADLIQIAYSSQDEYGLKLERMIPTADIVFVTGVYEERLPKKLLEEYTNKTYYVGRKWFGYSNGFAYSRRLSDRYYELSLSTPQEVLADLDLQRLKYGDHFIDIQRCLVNKDGRVPVFSDEKKMISQDCTHLTRGGARFVARKVDLSKIFGI